MLLNSGEFKEWVGTMSMAMSDNRRDYGPKGCVGIVVGVLYGIIIGVVLMVSLTLVQADPKPVITAEVTVSEPVRITEDDPHRGLIGDDGPRGRIQEDSPDWNCRTMGNRICGP